MFGLSTTSRASYALHQSSNANGISDTVGVSGVVWFLRHSSEGFFAGCRSRKTSPRLRRARRARINSMRSRFINVGKASAALISIGAVILISGILLPFRQM